MPLHNMAGRRVGAQVERPDSSPPAASPILETDRRGAAGSAALHFTLDTPEAQALRLGLAVRGGRRVPDANFDRFLSADLRAVSWTYWTPLDAAARAAQWLRELQVRTVVDIGSGVGKFCIAAALGSSCSFTGLEQRPHLVGTARGLARLFNLKERVQFMSGVFGRISTPPADCYYLFNPFGESLFDPEDQLDEDVDLSHARYLNDIAMVERFLDSVPIGTYVMTYNGFGGTLSNDFDEVRIDPKLRCVLRMVRRERNSGVTRQSPTEIAPGTTVAGCTTRA